MSSEDTGVDEAQVQSLLKKHKDVTDELKHYANVIQQLKQQVCLQLMCYEEIMSVFALK